MKIKIFFLTFFLLSLPTYSGDVKQSFSNKNITFEYDSSIKMRPQINSRMINLQKGLSSIVITEMPSEVQPSDEYIKAMVQTMKVSMEEQMKKNPMVTGLNFSLVKTVTFEAAKGYKLDIDMISDMKDMKINLYYLNCGGNSIQVMLNLIDASKEDKQLFMELLKSLKPVISNMTKVELSKISTTKLSTPKKRIKDLNLKSFYLRVLDSESELPLEKVSMRIGSNLEYSDAEGRVSFKLDKGINNVKIYCDSKYEIQKFSGTINEVILNVHRLSLNISKYTKETDPFIVYMKPPGIVQVSFLTEKPIPDGTKVKLGTHFFGDHKNGRRLYSTINGNKAEFKGLGSKKYKFHFEVDGYAPTEYKKCIIEPRKTSYLEIQLDKGIDFSGKVVDNNGTPIEGVEVVACVDKELFGSSPQVRLRTKKNGSFDFKNIKKNEQYFFFRKENYRSVKKKYKFNSNKNGIKVELVKMDRTIAQLIDNFNKTLKNFIGDRCLKITLHKYVKNKNSGRYKYHNTCTHDKDGSFIINGLEKNEKYYLELVSNYFAYQKFYFDTNKEVKNLKISLNKGLTLYGKAICEGQPLQDVTLDVRPYLGYYYLGNGSFLTDKHGVFVVNGLAEGMQIELSVVHRSQGYKVQKKSRIVKYESGKDFVVYLDSCTQLKGSLVDNGNNTIKNYQYELFEMYKKRKYKVYRTKKDDDDGKFITGPYIGTFFLKFYKEGFEDFESELFELKENSPIKTLNIMHPQILK